MKKFNLLHKPLLLIFAFVAFSFTIKKDNLITNSNIEIYSGYKEVLILSFKPGTTQQQMDDYRDYFINKAYSVNLQYAKHPQNPLNESWLVSTSIKGPKGITTNTTESDDEEAEKAGRLLVLSELYNHMGIVNFIDVIKDATYEDFIISYTYASNKETDYRD
ncbi:hypothetical protein F7018_13260 [Tenacibaculum aiptasiae]|uniref:Uncharacterized protein n=1 Tax=Tenacibaculum aiptasiae TaxID=426481 RepID=A0A7J5ABH7_9FLAO|nr:hypothetical protein [Tenacibaculum aiptasiae]KAB1154499.1 hypothetical protein F7018_13260 [Tenacibaculum aiptasiae]